MSFCWFLLVTKLSLASLGGSFAQVTAAPARSEPGQALQPPEGREGGNSRFPKAAESGGAAVRAGKASECPGRRESSTVRSGRGPGQEGFGEGWLERRLSGGQVNPSHAGIFQAVSQVTAREDGYNTCLQSPKGY